MSGGFREFAEVSVHGKGESFAGATGDCQRISGVIHNECFIDCRNFGAIKAFDGLADSCRDDAGGDSPGDVGQIDASQ
ncbi:MAG UNVERIFIED_CONTAM: hypothetical protein LVR18_02985 [Planctomycetaceae bacterium]